METFKTHNNLLLYIREEEVPEDNLEYVVCIVGTREKELLRTPDKDAAETYFNNLKTEYEERAKVEA